MRILVVEDHRDIAANLGQFLEGRGHIVDFAYDGVTGLHLAVVNDFDVIVLDLTLPGIDGLDLCRKLRAEAGRNTPLLMLTARDTLNDKLDGFAAGGDDYLVKPFSMLELEARLLALQRRSEHRGRAEIITIQDLVFDPNTLTVERAGREIRLGPTGYKILELLMRASPAIVRRAAIEQEIWGDAPPDSDALRAHIHTLRNAIDKPFPVKLLHTVHSTGYRLCPPDEV